MTGPSCPCGHIRKRWFFDSTSGSCMTFRYGGCGGNDNRFKTLEECQARCVKAALTGLDLERPSLTLHHIGHS